MVLIVKIMLHTKVQNSNDVPIDLTGEISNIQTNVTTH